MSTLRITPRTSGILKVFVEQDVAGSMTPATGAQCAADVFLPDGTRLATNVSMSDVGGGYYTLAINPSWSLDAYQRVVLGKYRAVVRAVIGASEFTQAFDFDVLFA